MPPGGTAASSAPRSGCPKTPSPELPHYCFLLEADHGVLFCSDLITRPTGKELHFVPFEYHEDPAATRHSVERLLDLPFEILCLAHGAPLIDGPKSCLLYTSPS